MKSERRLVPSKKKPVGSLLTYFNPSELQQFSPAKKKRLKNLRKNYELLHSLGFHVEKPDFMKRKSSRLPYGYAENGEFEDKSDVSDMEWTPNMDWEMFTDRRKVLPFKRTAAKNRVMRIRTKKSETTNEDEETGGPPRTRRNPKLGPEIYCADCCQGFTEECPLHGPVTIIENTKVQFCQQAWQTLPASLSVRNSKIPGAGLGVWTNEIVRNRTWFGPYEGKLITDPVRADESGYCWKIGPGDLFIDAEDESASNWLRYVNCCRSKSEQNLKAYQFRGEIYYRSIRDIPAGEELLVWYGEDYAQELGIKLDRMNSRVFYPHRRRRKAETLPTCSCTCDLSITDVMSHGKGSRENGCLEFQHSQTVGQAVSCDMPTNSCTGTSLLYSDKFDCVVRKVDNSRRAIIGSWTGAFSCEVAGFPVTMVTQSNSQNDPVTMVTHSNTQNNPVTMVTQSNTENDHVPMVTQSKSQNDPVTMVTLGNTQNDPVTMVTHSNTQNDYIRPYNSSPINTCSVTPCTVVLERQKKPLTVSNKVNLMNSAVVVEKLKRKSDHLWDRVCDADNCTGEKTSEQSRGVCNTSDQAGRVDNLSTSPSHTDSALCKPCRVSLERIDQLPVYTNRTKANSELIIDENTENQTGDESDTSSGKKDYEMEADEDFGYESCSALGDEVGHVTPVEGDELTDRVSDDTQTNSSIENNLEGVMETEIVEDQAAENCLIEADTYASGSVETSLDFRVDVDNSSVEGIRYTPCDNKTKDTDVIDLLNMSDRSKEIYNYLMTVRNNVETTDDVCFNDIDISSCPVSDDTTDEDCCNCMCSSPVRNDTSDIWQVYSALNADRCLGVELDTRVIRMLNKFIRNVNGKGKKVIKKERELIESMKNRMVEFFLSRERVESVEKPNLRCAYSGYYNQVDMWQTYADINSDVNHDLHVVNKLAEESCMFSQEKMSLQLYS